MVVVGGELPNDPRVVVRRDAAKRETSGGSLSLVAMPPP